MIVDHPDGTISIVIEDHDEGDTDRRDADHVDCRWLHRLDAFRTARLNRGAPLREVAYHVTRCDDTVGAQYTTPIDALVTCPYCIHAGLPLTSRETSVRPVAVLEARLRMR